MKLISIIALSLLLSGCLSTLPNWPDSPEGPSDSCPQLKLIPNGTTKLSEVLDIINDNYADYHKCSAKVDLWNKWYDKQKKNYEEVDED